MVKERSSNRKSKHHIRFIRNKKYDKVEVSYDPLVAGSIDGTDTQPHDNGIVRAINSSFEPSSRVDGNPYATIFIWRLDRDVPDQFILDKFFRFGEIVKGYIVRDIVTGFSKGYGFIEFAREDDAFQAFMEGRNFLIGGRKIMLDFERGRTLPGWRPRRLGGGFGGKRESGQLRFGGRSCPIAEPLTVNSKRPRSPDRNEDRKDRKRSK